MNKRQQCIYNRWLESENSTLRECYSTYSYAKQNAYKGCFNRYTNKGGHRFRIISYNTCQFTIGFTFIKDGLKYFHYESSHKMEEWQIE